MGWSFATKSYPPSDQSAAPVDRRVISIVAQSRVTILRIGKHMGNHMGNHPISSCFFICCGLQLPILWSDDVLFGFNKIKILNGCSDSHYLCLWAAKFEKCVAVEHLLVTNTGQTLLTKSGAYNIGFISFYMSTSISLYILKDVYACIYVHIDILYVNNNLMQDTDLMLPQ